MLVMMSRLGTKTYSRKQECKTSIQFDQMLSDKSNKPTTTKVAMTTVHRSRWGMTSFTSLRKTHLNGQKDVSENSESSVTPSIAPKRIKVDPKSISSFGEDPFSFDIDAEPSTAKISQQSSSLLITKGTKGQNVFTIPKPNKFFKSGASRISVTGTSSQKKVNNDLKFSVEVLGSNKINNVSKLSMDQYSCKLVSKLSENSGSKIQNCGLVNRSNLPSNISTSARLSEVTSLCASNVVSHSPIKNVGDNIPGTNSGGNVPLFQRNISNIFDTGTRTNSPSIINNNNESNGNSYSRKQEHSSENSTKSVNCETDDRFESVFRSVVTKTYGGKKNSEHFQKGSKIIKENLPVIKDLHQLPLPSMKDNPSDSKSSNQDNLWEEESNSEPMTISESSDNEQIDTFDKNSSFSSKSLHLESEINTKCSGLKGNHSLNRKRIFNSPKKNKPVYKLRHWQETASDDFSNSSKEASANIPSLADDFDEIEKADTAQFSLTKEIQFPKSSSAEAVISVKCPRKEKELYTVVKNVKQAYQCHESGETQEFNDDVEYLLEGLQIANVGTRCLSILSLASKCMGPAFRIHLRAHGTISKIFSALKDAPLDTSLSLCTATLMFVLSQDRLTMDLEASTLSLMLQLLESDPQQDRSSNWDEIKSSVIDNADGSLPSSLQEKHREKVRQLVEQMQQKGHAKHLSLDNINTGNLAMETLLSLTSRRAGEWFKEELRSLGGMDHLVDTVSACANQLNCNEVKCLKYPSDIHLDKLRKIDRCLRVLENVTYANTENQSYLLTYKHSLLVTTCASMLELCRASLMIHPICKSKGTETEYVSTSSDDPGVVFLSCLLSLLKVLLNITHENAYGSSTVGIQEGLISCVLLCVLQIPRCIPNEKRFDVLVLSLGLMINLVEHCKENRDQIVQAYCVGSYETPNDGKKLSALEALVEVFLVRLEAAKKSEEQADALLTSPEEKKEAESKKDGKENTPSLPQPLPAEDLEETLMKALQKAGKNMEHSVIGSYIALLLGCVIQNNQDYANMLREKMPERKFDIMLEVLKKFLNFVSLTGVVGSAGITSIQRVVEVLESS